MSDVGKLIKAPENYLLVDKYSKEALPVLGFVDGMPRVDLADREWSSSFTSLEDCILLRYTGIYDKTGQELLEGDLFFINQTVNGCDTFRVTVSSSGVVGADYGPASYNGRLLKTGHYDKSYEYDLRDLYEVDLDMYDKEILRVGDYFKPCF